MIYAVWGCNGSGKTTLAIEMSVTIGEMGKTVCIISAEDYAEMSIRFGKVFPEAGITDVMKDLGCIKNCCHEVAKNVFFLGPTQTDTALSLHFSGTQAETLLNIVNDLFDIVIVDGTTWKANAITGKAMALSKIIFIPIPAKTSAKMWMIANQQILAQRAASIVYLQNETTPHFDFPSMLKAFKTVQPVASLPYVPDYPDFINQGKVLCRDTVVGKNVKKFKMAIQSLVR